MDFLNRIVAMWEDFNASYVLELVLLTLLFFMIFKVLKSNKAWLFIPLICFIVLLCGFAFALAANMSGEVLILVVLMIALLIFTMYHTEIKRGLINSSSGLVKRKSTNDNLTVSGVEFIINETVRALQNMSKNDVGALIVLSNDNLPEGIIESGTVINADINAPMIEAVFYPKAPLHDGAMIILDNKIYAAGCFLPIVQNENLPQDLGSRHRAALGVTLVANVTAIIVSEETGIISIAKNGNLIKRYAGANDLRNALSEYYWSDLTAEGR